MATNDGENWKDPTVEEVRRARDEHADRFDYGLKAICADLRMRLEILSLTCPLRPLTLVR